MPEQRAVAAKPDLRRRTRAWRLALWGLQVGFLFTAVLNLMHVRGGFLTSHAADLVVPALLYVFLRGLADPGRTTLLGPVFGRSPELTAVVVFVCSAMTEFSQQWWPRGIFAGRFDPLDLLAYALGLAICYGCERRWPNPTPAAVVSGGARA